MRLRWLGLLLLAAACNQDPKPLPETQPSPNASILPAPLAPAGELVRQPKGSASATAPVGMPVDSAGRPIILRQEDPPAKPVNITEPLPRDRLTAKESVGLTLVAAFHWSDLPPRPSLPQMNPAAIDAASKASSLGVLIDLAYAGRMRLSIESPVFPLPGQTEFRSRSDLLGHTLVWPTRTAYRALAPGSIRALFAERRPDVTPVMRGKPVAKGEATRLGLPTLRTEVSTKVGTATLDQARLEGSGASGKLLCRFLFDLIALDPSTDACSDDRVPLHAEFSWTGGGKLTFSVSAIENRQDLPSSFMLVPPLGAEFRPGEIPSPAAGVFLTREQLAAFRKRPEPAPTAPGAPGEGVLAVNHTDTLRYLLIDGVPVAWVDPHTERYIIGPKPGRYAVSWRDFLGTSIEPPQIVQVPARLEIGAPTDAGALP